MTKLLFKKMIQIVVLFLVMLALLGFESIVVYKFLSILILAIGIVLLDNWLEERFGIPEIKDRWSNV